MNKKGQEAGQALSTLITFFAIVILLVIFYWVSSVAGLFTRGADATSLDFYSGSAGNPKLINVPETSDDFLKRPVLVQFGDGDIQLIPLNVLIALYRSDRGEIDRISSEISKESTQDGKDRLSREMALAYSHSVNQEIFENSMREFLARQGELGRCIIIAQDIGRDLKGRILSAPNGYDFFLKNVGDFKTDEFRLSSDSLYFGKLSRYTYLSKTGEDVLVEYYYGPCLGGEK